MTQPTDIDTLKRSIRDLLELLELLRAADEYQWTSPKITNKSFMADGSLRFTTEDASPYSHSDPTGDTVTDPTRLKLRAKVNRTGVDIRELSRVTAMMRDRIEVALKPWTG